MLLTVGYFIGRALQLLGMGTAVLALLVFWGQMGPMMKLAGLGLVEFYIGYGVVSLTGRVK